MTNSYRMKALEKLLAPVTNYFEDRGIAGTFPIMIVIIVVVSVSLIRRRKNKIKFDTYDFLHILIVVGMIIIFLLDQFNVNPKI